jgi:hypothetical protein
MSYDASKLFVRIAAQMSESTLVFNTWIVSPATTSSCRLQGNLLGQTSRSVVYAISEPFYTYFFARITANGELSCILILVSGLHLMLSAHFWMTLDKRVEDLRLASSQTKMQVSPTEEPQDQPTGLSTDSFATVAMQILDAKVLYLYAFAHVQFAAAGNATLLFVAQKLDVINIDSFATHLFALGAALLYFFLSRLGEWYFARSAGLSLFYGSGRTARLTAEQLGYLVLLNTVRSSVRWFVGLRYPFAGAGVDDGVDTRNFSGDMGIGDALRRLPNWVLPCMFLLGLGLTYVKAAHMGRASVVARRT